MKMVSDPIHTGLWSELDISDVFSIGVIRGEGGEGEQRVTHRTTEYRLRVVAIYLETGKGMWMSECSLELSG